MKNDDRIRKGIASLTLIAVTALCVGKALVVTSMARKMEVGAVGRGESAGAKARNVLDADLSLAQTVAPNPVGAGANLTFTITVTNNGPGAADAVTVTDNLPASTSFVSCNATGGGSCGGTGNNRTVSFASLAAGASATITLIARVDCYAVNNAVIGNLATVSSLTSDPDVTNNSATANVTVLNPTAIAPTSAFFLESGGIVVVNVTFPGGCNWTAVSNVPWITLDTAGGTGDGSVVCIVPVNPSSLPRTGTVTIAGLTLTVTQNGQPCLSSVSPINKSFDAGGGTGKINVGLLADCPWTAVSNDAWITITAGGSGSGNGKVSYVVAANSTQIPRTGTITIAGRTFTINQAGCTTISPTLKLVAASGGTGNVNVTAPAGCAWDVVKDSVFSWLTITSGSSGAGNGTVSFSVAANPDTFSRTAVFTIGGRNFRLWQEGTNAACTTESLLLDQSLTRILGNGSCRSAKEGSYISNGLLAYYAARYTFSGLAGLRVAFSLSSTSFDTEFRLFSPAGDLLAEDDDGGGGTDSRIPSTSGFFTLPTTGTYIIEVTSFPALPFNSIPGGYTLSATLFSCTPTLSPTSQNFGPGGGIGQVQVTSPQECNWTATSNAGWLTVNSGSGSGNGGVSYTVATNSSTAPRAATIAIGVPPSAIQNFQVVQAGDGSACLVNPIGIGQTVNGALSATDCRSPVVNTGWFADRYSFIGLAGQQIAISMATSGWSARLILLDSTQAVIASDVTFDPAARIPPGSGFFTLPSTGTYFIEATSQASNTTGDYTLSLTDQTGCVFAIAPAGQSFPIAGGTGSVNVTTAAGCNWTATSNDGFIMVTGGGNGAGSGTVTYAVAPNTGVARTGSLTIAGQQFTVTQAGCPTITIAPTTLPAGAAGLSYNQTLTASGGLAPYNFTLISGALPNGLSLSSGGLIAGAPTAFGTFDFTAQAADANGCTGTRAYSLVVSPCGGTILLSPMTLPGGSMGELYNQTITASGGTAPYAFSVSAGALPGGLSLSSGGSLSGTLTAFGTFAFTVKATDANGCMGTRNYSVVISPGGLQFYPLAHPVRLLDTRIGASGCYTPNAAIPGGTSRTQPARGLCDGLTIPANAAAITGNITTVQSGGGYLTLYPSDAAQPLVANSNYNANEILNNVFTVGLGNADGAFKIFVTSNTQVVVDVTGYYAPLAAGGLYFHPLPKPIRLLDTRVGATGCTTPNAPLAGNADTTQPARLTCDGVTIPATAKAIVGNATTVNPQGPGFPYLTLFPADATRPTVASSNYLPGQVMNAPFAVGLSAAGEFKIYPTTQTELIIDVLGYYSAEANDGNGAGLLFYPLAHPVRLLDTRAGATGCYAPSAPLLAASTRTQVARGVCDGLSIANEALGIVGNATVVNTAGGYLTFWPSAAAQPLVATSNFAAGQVFNRHFTVGLGAGDGAFKIFTQLQTDLVVDVSGYFAP